MTRNHLTVPKNIANGYFSSKRYQPLLPSVPTKKLQVTFYISKIPSYQKDSI